MTIPSHKIVFSEQATCVLHNIGMKKMMMLVGCGLTSHSAIFQLYSDGTFVHIPNSDLVSGNQRHGQLGVFLLYFSVPCLPRHGPPLRHRTGQSERSDPIPGL